MDSASANPPKISNPHSTDKDILTTDQFTSSTKTSSKPGWKGHFHRENAGKTLGWYPSCLSLPRSPLKGNIPNTYPLYKVYMGLIIKGPPSQGALSHHFPYETWNLIEAEVPHIVRPSQKSALCQGTHEAFLPTTDVHVSTKLFMTSAQVHHILSRNLKEASRQNMEENIFRIKLTHLYGICREQGTTVTCSHLWALPNHLQPLILGGATGLLDLLSFVGPSLRSSVKHRGLKIQA